MASSRSYERSSSSLQKEREITKKKREQQFETKEKSEPKPVFTQPRKLSTTGNDALSESIRSILGDSQTFKQNILDSSKPNMWLGTSRSQNTSSTPGTPLIPESSEPPLNHNSHVYSPSRSYSNNKKSSHSKSSSSDHRSSNDRNSNHNSRDMERHPTKHHPAASGSIAHSKRSPHVTPPSSKSGYSNINHSRHDTSSTANISTLSNNHGFGIPDEDYVLNDDGFPLAIKPAGRFSDRSRLSSVDSDYTANVEKIFEIMKIPPEPLTAIQTPCAQRDEYLEKFTKRKPLGHQDSDAGSMTGRDKMSDSDSSDDSSDEEETKPKADTWLLGPREEEDHKKKNDQVKKRESERVKSKQRAPSSNPRSSHRKSSNYNRGRDIVKQSRSSVHSSTSSHRSASSDRGSVSSPRRRSENLSSKTLKTDSKQKLSSSSQRSPKYPDSNCITASNHALSSVTSGGGSVTSRVSPRQGNPHQFVAKKGINNSLKNPSLCKSDESDMEAEEQVPKVDTVPIESDSDTSDSYQSDSSDSDSDNETKTDWGLASLVPTPKTSSKTNQSTSEQAKNDTIKHSEPTPHFKSSSPHSNSYYGSDIYQQSPRDHKGSSTSRSKVHELPPFNPLSMKLHCYLFNCETERNLKNRSPRIEKESDFTTVNSKLKPQLSEISSGYNPTVSTGSETDQPLRRAKTVHIAKVWPDSTSTTKRKHQNNESSLIGYDGDHPSNMHQSKRRKQEQSPNQNQSRLSPESWQHKKQDNRISEHRLSPHKSSHNQRTPTPQQNNNSRNNSPSSENKKLCRTNRTLATPGVAGIVPEPDSSWPEQERLQTADQYMMQGKRLKHDGDALTDSRTGKTRPGQHHLRALAYFEAALCFIMTGYVMEIENNAERSDTGSSSGSSSTSHSPPSMYLQTITLLDYVLKMRPNTDHVDTAFRRISASCYRCQSVLYFRIFKLKKDLAVRYSEELSEQFKSSKSSRTPSPWHHTNSTQSNVLSPMSPAVPSPFGVPGPSPAGVNSSGAEVSSSTQPGKMTPTQKNHNSVIIPQKTYDIFRQHHTIINNLVKAHEKWDLAEHYVEDHKDFFRNIDTLCSRTLTFHSSLRDIVIYNRVVLHQLRAIISGSPQDGHT